MKSVDLVIPCYNEERMLAGSVEKLRAWCSEQLGAYRYLVHLELDDAPRDRYRQSVEQLTDYDRRRGARLVETLEQYLADRGSITASARTLYVHPNTVRQRLERIERVAELDLSSEDLLSLELALKLVRLHRVRAGQE